MRFQVPQYIEMEDKIFGPFTFKQFIYLAGGTGISAVIYFLIKSFFISLLFILPVMILSAMLAFYQHNNKPFIYLVESFFYYLIGDKLYIWKKENKKIISKTNSGLKSGNESGGIPKITQGTLHELSWKLDLKEPDKKISDR